MRALFLALVLINLGFFFWQYTLSGGRPPVPRSNEVTVPQDDTVPQLKLLSKAHGDKGAPPAAVTPVETDVCFIVGPFADETEARTVVEDFTAKGIDAAYKPIQQQSARYWLHTPQLPDHKAAEAKLNELKGLGFDDVAIMETGDLTNSLSLGFYHNPSSAEQRMAELQAKGVKVIQETQQRTLDTHWVRYQAPPGDAAADAVWKTVSQARSDIQREDLPCH